MWSTKRIGNRRRRALLLAAAWLGTIATPAAAATLRYFQATGLAELAPSAPYSERIIGYSLESQGEFFVDPARASVFAGSEAFFGNSSRYIGDNDLSFAGTTDPISLGQLFASPLSAADELRDKFTNRIYVPVLGGGEHLIDLEFIGLDGVATIPSPPVIVPPMFTPPAVLPPAVLPPPVLPPGTVPGPPPPGPIPPPTGEPFPPVVQPPVATGPGAVLRYFQATGLAELLPADSPSGRILGYNLASNGEFFADPARASAFAGSEAYFENNGRTIGDNDLSYEGTSQSISLGQLFASTLMSADELASKFTNRIYVPSLGGGEHAINLEFVDLDGAVQTPSPPVVLPPALWPPELAPPVETPPLFGPPDLGPDPTDPGPALPPGDAPTPVVGEQPPVDVTPPDVPVDVPPMTLPVDGGLVGYPGIISFPWITSIDWMVWTDAELRAAVDFDTDASQLTVDGMLFTQVAAENPSGLQMTAFAGQSVLGDPGAQAAYLTALRAAISAMNESAVVPEPPAALLLAVAGALAAAARPTARRSPTPCNSTP